MKYGLFLGVVRLGTAIFRRHQLVSPEGT